VTLGDAGLRKFPYEMIYREVTKNSITTCHLSSVIGLAATVSYMAIESNEQRILAERDYCAKFPTCAKFPIDSFEAREYKAKRKRLTWQGKKPFDPGMVAGLFTFPLLLSLNNSHTKNTNERKKQGHFLAPPHRLFNAPE
jgi:hypothetical protein